MANGRMTLHILWAGVLLAVSAQLTWAAVTVARPTDSTAVTVVVLAVIGPVMTGIGAMLARLADRIQPPPPPPVPPST